jgi:hypothetical protein
VAAAPSGCVLAMSVGREEEERTGAFLFFHVFDGMYAKFMSCTKIVVLHWQIWDKTDFAMA